MEAPAGYEAVAQEEMMTAALPLSPEELYVTVTSTAPQALLGPQTVVLTTGMSAITLWSPPGQRSLGLLQHGVRREKMLSWSQSIAVKIRVEVELLISLQSV